VIGTDILDVEGSSLSYSYGEKVVSLAGLLWGKPEYRFICIVQGEIGGYACVKNLLDGSSTLLLLLHDTGRSRHYHRYLHFVDHVLGYAQSEKLRTMILNHQQVEQQILTELGFILHTHHHAFYKCLRDYHG
jgi:hypothetical protein